MPRLSRGATGRRPTGTFAGLRRLSDWWLIPDSYAGWARRAHATAERLARRGGYHAMLSSSPPDSVHLAARAVQRASGLPWVADFRDPWVGLHFRDPPSAWHRARHAALERAVLEEADVVVAASRTHAEGIGRHSGARPRRVVHIPNGFEREEDAGGTGPATAGDRERSRGCIGPRPRRLRPSWAPSRPIRPCSTAISSAS